MGRLGRGIVLGVSLWMMPDGLLAASDAANTSAEEESRNELGWFLGAAFSEGESAASIGIDYERRLSRRFGVGGLAEYTGGDFRDGILGVPFTWHVRRELKVYAAAGMEFDRGGEDFFLIRLGAGYGFDLGKGLEVAPAVNIDFTSEETTLVLGASLAWGF